MKQFIDYSDQEAMHSETPLIWPVTPSLNSVISHIAKAETSKAFSKTKANMQIY